MKKLLIILVFISGYTFTILSMEHNSAGSYVSLETNPNQEYGSDTEENPFSGTKNTNIAINNHKTKEHIVTVYQQNQGVVLPGNWVVINGNKESLKLRVGRAIWKHYLTPTAFKNCSCGALAIIIAFTLFKMHEIMENFADGQSSISRRDY